MSPMQSFRACGGCSQYMLSGRALNHQATPSGSQHQLKTETTPAWTPRHGLGHARTSLRPRGRLGCQVHQSGHAVMRLHPRLLLPAAQRQPARFRLAALRSQSQNIGNRRKAAQAHEERRQHTDCSGNRRNAAQLTKSVAQSLPARFRLATRRSHIRNAPREMHGSPQQLDASCCPCASAMWHRHHRPTTDGNHQPKAWS